MRAYGKPVSLITNEIALDRAGVLVQHQHRQLMLALEPPNRKKEIKQTFFCSIEKWLALCDICFVVSVLLLARRDEEMKRSQQTKSLIPIKVSYILTPNYLDGIHSIDNWSVGIQRR